MKRILVVDDDLAVGQLVTEVLQENYAVTVASNGAQALDCIRRLARDAIVWI